MSHNCVLDLVVEQTERAQDDRLSPTPVLVKDELGGHLLTTWFVTAMNRHHVIDKVVHKASAGRLWVRWVDYQHGTKEGWVDCTELKQYPAVRKHLYRAYLHLANLCQSRAYTIRG